MKKIYITIALSLTLIINAQDGTLDTTFGTDGILDIPDLCKVTSAKIQPDGKIVGSGYIIESDLSYKACIFRLNPEGSLDTSFGSGGKLVFNYYSTYDNVLSLELYPDGKILAGLEYGKLLRLNQNGSYDTTFGNGGIVDTTGYYIALQPNGKILSTAVYTNGYFKIFSHIFNGNLDYSFNEFGSNNILINSTSCTVKDITFQPNGQILVTGYGPNAPYSPNMRTIRLNADGTSDTTFSLPTVSALKIPEKIYFRNNSIFILTKMAANSNSVAVMKYDSSNSLDVSFDNDGYSLLNYSDPVSEQNAPSMLNFQPDGKIIMTGKRAGVSNPNVNFDGIISRQNTDGSLDTTFGTNGYTSLYLWSNAYEPLLSLISPIDGKLIVLGNYLTGAATVRVAKYNTGIVLKNQDFNSKKVVLYPNPTNDYIDVNCIETVKELKVLDMLGRTALMANYNSNRIEVRSLSNGVYLIEVKTENKIYQEKFIKN